MRAAKGGDWGWHQPSDLKEKISQPLFKLPAGSTFLYRAIESNNVLIFRVEERKRAGLEPLERARDDVIETVARQHEKEVETRWLESLRPKATIVRFPLD